MSEPQSRHNKRLEDSLEGIWFKPGSKRVDWGYINWRSEWSNSNRMHRETMCAPAFTKDLMQVDVFEHPELGRYIVHPRTGERRRAYPFCKWCGTPRAKPLKVYTPRAEKAPRVRDYVAEYAKRGYEKHPQPLSETPRAKYQRDLKARKALGTVRSYTSRLPNEAATERTVSSAAS